MYILHSTTNTTTSRDNKDERRTQWNFNGTFYFYFNVVFIKQFGERDSFEHKWIFGYPYKRMEKYIFCTAVNLHLFYVCFYAFFVLFLCFLCFLAQRDCMYDKKQTAVMSYGSHSETNGQFIEHTTVQLNPMQQTVSWKGWKEIFCIFLYIFLSCCRLLHVYWMASKIYSYTHTTHQHSTSYSSFLSSFTIASIACNPPKPTKKTS